MQYLFLDDEDFWRQQGVLAFGRAGLNFQASQDPEAVVRAANEIAALVCDHNLERIAPGCFGLDTLLAVRRVNSSAYLALYTAYGDIVGDDVADVLQRYRISLFAKQDAIEDVVANIKQEIGRLKDRRAHDKSVRTLEMSEESLVDTILADVLNDLERITDQSKNILWGGMEMSFSDLAQHVRDKSGIGMAYAHMWYRGAMKLASVRKRVETSEMS